ncbi:hypothetical protein BD410DRAFT_734297, partial [Rickenella mellea]
EEIERDQEQLEAELRKWRRMQRELMPAAGDAISNSAPCEIEDEILFLPSDFSAVQHTELGLTHLVLVEQSLRQGEANDALRDLRAAIKHSVVLRQQKRKNVHDQRPNTRAQQIIKSADNMKLRWATKYRHARRCLATLAFPEVDAKYPELHDQDMWMKTVDTAHTLGDGQKTEGWIWRVGPMGRMEDEEQGEWSLELDRVQWFRAMADKDRWQEEVEILEAEFGRCVRSFRRMAAVWGDLARPQTKKGYAAYAWRQASMFGRMEKEAIQKFILAGGEDLTATPE